MKTLVCSLLIALLPMVLVAKNNSMEGKAYKGMLHQACKSFNDGACTVITYNTLTFSKDSVCIEYWLEADCQRLSSTEKRIETYAYKTEKKQDKYFVYIDGYEIKCLEVHPTKLEEVNRIGYYNRVFDLMD